MTCQGKWLYLEPIFSTDEIMKQIPREGAAFRCMDATWRRVMAKVWRSSSGAQMVVYGFCHAKTAESMPTMEWHVRNGVDVMFCACRSMSNH